MTREQVNKIFETELGQQLLSVFVTPDDNVFIRQSEAISYCKENLRIKHPKWREAKEIEEEPEVLELTIDQIAENYGVSPDIVKIKK